MQNIHADAQDAVVAQLDQALPDLRYAPLRTTRAGVLDRDSSDVGVAII